MSLSIILVGAAMLFIALTVLSLFQGLLVMGKPGEENAGKNNKLMQYRVLFQALALGCLALAMVV